MNILDILKGSIKQIRSSWPLLIGIYSPGILLFLGAGILSQIIPHLTIPELVGDVAVIGKIPFYSGAISQLGLLLWSAATTLCFFTYFSLKKTDGVRKESLNFMLSSGLLSGYLMLDDTYMLHEEFFPDYLKIIPEQMVIIILGISMLAYLFFNRNEILRGDYSLMLLAFMFFGISVTLDAIPTHLYGNIYFLEKIEHLFEDGAKFSAIVTWVTFYARYSFQQLSKQFSQKP
jgi:hypothetical protein